MFLLDKQSKATKRKWHRLPCLFLPVAGLLALIWFLVRVVPKPSRVAYPCQRAALPLASNFVAGLIGMIGSVESFRKVKPYFVKSNYVYVIGAIFTAVALGVALITISRKQWNTSFAESQNQNDPIGIAQGIHPGRVVWVHDPNATDWDGLNTEDGHWWESSNTNMAVVDQMMSRAILALAGETNSFDAWDKIFRFYNQTHGKEDVGYRKGEKITIKVNLVGYSAVWGGPNVNPETYDLMAKMDYMNTSPQMMLALLRQLIYIVDVNQADITIGDPLSRFPNQYYDILHDEFPNVQYLDWEGKFNRIRVQKSSVPFYWSCRPLGNLQDYVPVSYVQADYIINMANLKSHSLAGVTLCTKNHFGSLVRSPVQADYFNLHNDLPYYTKMANRLFHSLIYKMKTLLKTAKQQPFSFLIKTSESARKSTKGERSAINKINHYSALVDLMGHKHIGGKTLLYMIDGLYAGRHRSHNWPTKLNLPPFNGDWSSSLFISQDPVAIDSVAYDFLWAEPGWEKETHISGGDDYLHEAALADNPPSGTFYDPDHSEDVTRLTSLGVHEHWNNSIDKQYSRNLNTGDGIELVSLGSCNNNMSEQLLP